MDINVFMVEAQTGTEIMKFGRYWTFYDGAVVLGHNNEYWTFLTRDECIKYCLDGLFPTPTVSADCWSVEFIISKGGPFVGAVTPQALNYGSDHSCRP